MLAKSQLIILFRIKNYYNVVIKRLINLIYLPLLVSHAVDCCVSWHSTAFDSSDFIV